MIYNAYQRRPFRVLGFHDPDEIREIGIIFTPDIWANDTVYYRQDDENFDIVIPAIFTGVYYRVKTPGLSGSTEPTWNPTVGEITTDGSNGLTWEAVGYNLMPPDDLVASVTVTATTGVTITGVTYNTTSCQFTIQPVAASIISAGEFTTTARVVKTNSESFDVTLRFIVGSR